jgi:hypothetical protein
VCTENTSGVAKPARTKDKFFESLPVFCFTTPTEC